MEKQKVSIIVPVFNGEKHLKKCMDSIINQTFKEMEIIIVNDGSDDNTLVIAEEYCMKYKNIQVVTKENAGLPQARKTGFKYSNGEYVVFIDVDDWIEPNMVECLYNTIIKTSADIVSCNFVQEDSKGKFLVENGIVERKEYDSNQAIKEVLNRTSVFQYMWNKIFRRQIVKEENFPIGNFIGEDYCTVVPILETAEKIVHIPNVLYHYIQHGFNMTKSGFGRMYSLGYENCNYQKCYLMDKYPLLRRNIVNFHVLEEIGILNSMLRNNQFDVSMRDNIIDYIRKNVWSYVFTSHAKLLYKGSAIVIAFNWRIYRKVYLKIC